jgi:hypothetical protein
MALRVALSEGGSYLHVRGKPSESELGGRGCALLHHRRGLVRQLEHCSINHILAPAVVARVAARLVCGERHCQPRLAGSVGTKRVERVEGGVL